MTVICCTKYYKVCSAWITVGDVFSLLSAGLGRSGTFMGIDIGIQQVKECVVMVRSLLIVVSLSKPNMVRLEDNRNVPTLCRKSSGVTMDISSFCTYAKSLTEAMSQAEMDTVIHHTMCSAGRTAVTMYTER